MEAYRDVVDDLAEEQAALDGVLARLTPEQWDLPTHAPGWRVRHQVAHLARFDHTAALAMFDVAAFRADRLSEAEYLAAADRLTPSEILGQWRAAWANLRTRAASLDPSARLPWYGPDMSAT